MSESKPMTPGMDAFCREHLTNYTPGQIEIVNALPRNAIGKIDTKN